METNIIYNENAETGLKKLPDNSVDCCVTSPPYYRLRDYGTAKWHGGDPNCNHKGRPMQTKANINAHCGTGTDRKNAECHEFYKSVCGKCGAIRIDEQIGLEETPQQYIHRLVTLFDEVRRVLKPTGTLWINIGDSYAGSGKGAAAYPENAEKYLQRSNKGTFSPSTLIKHVGYKPKDLIGIPWMLAFALRDSGWYLRQDIIWNKLNPMPESVTDRCTKSHEYIFLLSKNRKYYFDNTSISEPSASYDTILRDRETTKLNNTPGRTKMKGLVRNDYPTRNKRSVWTVASQPLKEAHFATFPEKLITDSIKAGSPENGIVLDPFMGSGTTAIVSRKLNRNYIGFELNPQYIRIAQERMNKELGIFA